MPVSLLALDGQVIAYGGGGAREIPLMDFFAGLFENSLKPDEFVLELSMPAPADRSASAFIKMETNANDLAILNTAVFFSVNRRGKCENARVFVGGAVGEAPVRATSAEELLKGQKLSEADCSEAGEAAKSDVDPLDDHRASAAYRKAMTGVLVERALKKTIERLG